MTIRVKAQGKSKRIYFDCDDCKTRSRSIELQDSEVTPGVIWWEPSLKVLGGFVVTEELFVLCVCASCQRRRLGGREQTSLLGLFENSP